MWNNYAGNPPPPNNPYAYNPPPPVQYQDQSRGWAPPPGPAPGQYGGGGGGYPAGGGGGGYQPPQQQGGYPGAQFHNGGSDGGYPGQQQHQYGGGGGGGGWAPPTGAPPPSNYAPNSGGYQPPQQQHGSYAPPSGAPPRPPQGSQQYGPQFQGQGGAAQRPFFQYSQCNGRRKALLIGINYFKQQGELRGCINDVHNIQKFLVERHGYKPADMVVLTDDSRNPQQIPTRANMIKAMQWLVAGAQPNDSLFFHYSGHGGQTQDVDGDEDDGNDEVIYPVDYKQTSHIVDDELHAIMVRPLPPGCRLTAIFDSCHSATALDLPYVYSTQGVIKEPNLLAEAGKGVLNAGMSYLKGDIGGMMSGVMGIGKSLLNGGGGEARQKTIQTKTSPADVVMWSGCKDSQTSADTQEAGKATGAMSYAFIAALTKNPQQSYIQLLNSIRQELQGRYDQKPQLSSSHPMDTNLLFIL